MSLVTESRKEPMQTQSDSFWSKHWQKLVALALWAGVITAYIGYANANDVSPWGWSALQHVLGLLQHPIYGPLIFIALYALRPLIFFSAAFLTIAGGSLFGPLLGVIYTIVGANMSALIAYGVGRYLGEGLVDSTEEAGLVKRYADRMREDSFETVLIMRFIYLPYDLVNYLAGLLRIDWKAFLFATALGSIPGTIAFSLFGASLDLANYSGGLPAFDWRVFAFGIIIFLVSIGLSQYFKRREQNKSA